MVARSTHEGPDGQHGAAPPEAVATPPADRERAAEESPRESRSRDAAGVTTDPTPATANGSAGSVTGPHGSPYEGPGFGLTARTRDEVESLGIHLGPALREHCGAALSEIEWFHSPWQRSGAATGRSAWRLPDGRTIPAIVKVPVGPREYLWTTQLGEVDLRAFDAPEARRLPIPRLLAGGTELGGYEIAWLVIERISGRPIARELSREHLVSAFEAAARFHALARGVSQADRYRPEAPANWAVQLDRSVRLVRDNPTLDDDAWLPPLREVEARLHELVAAWESRPRDCWCHGDLHPGNVMTRPAAEGETSETAVLLDLALVHPGHWIEDALYMERLFWGNEDKLYGVSPLDELAAQRAALGLANGDLGELRELARVRRVLMAATSPAFLASENNPRYLAAALETLLRRGERQDFCGV